MLRTQDLAKEAREYMIPLVFGCDNVTVESPTGLRLYPPLSSDWILTAVRYEPAPNTDGNITVTVTDTAGNVVGTIVLTGPNAAAARGLMTLSTDVARLVTHGANTGGANAYHAVSFTLGGPTSGRLLLVFHYRKVQPSGDLSRARLA